MSMINGTLKIELQSDLCPGSGYSFAGIVDSDVCYDKHGIPYISARSIKGCMREALDTLLYSKYKNLGDILFGKRGESDYDNSYDNQTIRIGNAYIEDYRIIRDFLVRHQIYNKQKLYETQDILERFTHVVGQTKMENGVADNTSLRYTRVVNQFYPMENTNAEKAEKLIFVADISADKDYIETIKDISRATRHIGLKRNRGFGLVRCWAEFDDGTDKSQTDISDPIDISDRIQVEELGGGKSRICFALRNIEPLMLSGSEEDISKDYITAQSVIGALAGRFIKKHGKGAAEKDEFKDLFLNGETIYTHLYPCEDFVYPCVEKRIHYPAPDYLNVLKKSKEYVFTLEEQLPEILPPDKVKNYDWRDGNKPKKLKGKYVSLTQNNLSVMEVSKDIIYHNRHSHGTDEEMLYSLEVITPGHIFAGTIVFPSEYKDELLSLLGAGDFYFGKSRSAQYGHCEIIDSYYIFFGGQSDDKIEAGHPILITFLSDTVLLKENDKGKSGEYTVYFDEVKHAVLKALNIIERGNGNQQYISSIQTTLITGYKGVWNLRRSPIPAIKAGSFMVVYADKEYTPKNTCIGEYVHEGYGRISITNADRYSYLNVPEEINIDVIGNCPYCVNGNAPIDEEQKEKIKKIIIPIFIDRWVDEMINNAISDRRFLLGGTNSAVGRWKLMLMESLDKKDSREKAYEEFKMRIESIKKPSSLEQGEKLIKWADEFRSKADETDEVTKIMKNLGLISESGDEADYIHSLMKARWSDYIMAILVNRKYTGKGE